MLFAVLLVINILVAIALTIVVLLQQSEGGALGMGGGPSGFMTARGAGNFLSKTTWILATIFIVLSLSMTLLQSQVIRSENSIDAGAVGRIDLSKIRNQAPAPEAPAGAPATGPLQAPSPSLLAPPPAAPTVSTPLNLTPAPAPATK